MHASRLGLHVGLARLGLQGLAHAERDAGLVEGLVCSQCHADLVTDAQQQQPALGGAYCHLADDLIYPQRVTCAM